MATREIELEKGLEIDGAFHKKAILRELTVGDIIDANAEAERFVQDANGDAQLAVSPTLADAHLLRRQIESIGSIQGPLTLGMLRKLSDADLALLMEATDEMGNAVAKRLAARGRSEPPGGGD